jgi:hypothetical protein
MEWIKERVGVFGFGRFPLHYRWGNFIISPVKSEAGNTVCWTLYQGQHLFASRYCFVAPTLKQCKAEAQRLRQEANQGHLKPI